MKLSLPKNRYFAPMDNFKAGGNFKGSEGGQFRFEPLESGVNYVLDIVPPHFFPQGGNFTGEGRYKKQKTKNKSSGAL